MLLNELVERYSNEDQCKIAFKNLRLNEGVVCKQCGEREHYWISTREQFQCKQCKFRTTLRSGTVLQHSKLPYRYWFLSMYLMTMTKKGISATELQFHLGHKRYQPVWELMHKIRRGMGEREKKYLLKDEIEIDEAFFKTVNDLPSNKKLKPGKGSEQNTTVLVMAESLPVKELKKNKKPKWSRYFKMVVMPGLSQKQINQTVQENVDSKAQVLTDEFSSYFKLKNVIAKHETHKAKDGNSDKVMPWVHTAIANAKRNLLGIHHRVDGKYLQNYLNEFCYKVNRRNLKEKMFERLLIAVVTTCLCI
jgi:transposase-like protein